jgi:hypothetical protein
LCHSRADGNPGLTFFYVKFLFFLLSQLTFSTNKTTSFCAQKVSRTRHVCLRRLILMGKSCTNKIQKARASHCYDTRALATKVKRNQLPAITKDQRRITCNTVGSPSLRSCYRHVVLRASNHRWDSRTQ